MLVKINSKAPSKDRFFNSKAYEKSSRIINPLTGKPFSHRSVENEGAAFRLAKHSTMAMGWDREELQKLYDQSPNAFAMLLVDIGFDKDKDIEECRFINSHGREFVLMLQECDIEKSEKAGVPVLG